MINQRFTRFLPAFGSSLAKTGRQLWKILTFSLVEGIIFPAKSLCVSIGMTSVTVAYGSKFLSRIGIKGFREFPFEEERYPHPEHFADLVSPTLDELKADKTEITLSIPKSQAIIQFVELPLAVKENLSNVISYELDRLTPLSPENALYDFKILSEENGRIQILLMASRADFVNPYIEALGKKGIRVNRVTVNLSGICTFLTYMKHGPDTLYVEINGRGYEGCHIADGSILSAFSGRFSADKKEEWADAVVAEINPLIDAQHAQERPLKLIADYRDGRGAIPRQKLPLPVQNLRDMDMTLRFTENQQEVREIPCAAVGGVLESLWSKAGKLDLLSKGTRKGSKAPLVGTALLLFALTVIGFFYFFTPLQIEKLRLLEIDRQMALIKAEVRKVEAIKKEGDLLADEIAAINSFKQNRPMALAILKELTAVLPKTVWLTRLKITDAKVDIEGYAGAATEILPKLEASPYFRKVEFAAATTRDTRMNADRFTIKMEIKGFKNEHVETVKK